MPYMYGYVYYTGWVTEVELCIHVMLFELSDEFGVELYQHGSNRALCDRC